MNLKTSGILWLLLATWFTSSFASKTEAIRFAPLPMKSIESMTREYLPFMDFLKSKLNSPVELVYTKSYQELISSFIQGEIDVAYLGPLPYVILKEAFPESTPVALFLDSEGKSTATCALVEFAGNKVDLQSTNQKQVALTQPFSTCGYLAVESMLNQTGLSLEDAPFRYEFIDGHSAVAEQVILGHDQLGGLKTQIAEQYHHLGLRVLQETEPMPSFLFIANGKTLSPEKIAEIQNLLLSVKPLENPHDFETTHLWSSKIKYGAILATDSQYNSVRERWKHTKIDLMKQ